MVRGRQFVVVGQVLDVRQAAQIPNSGDPEILKSAAIADGRSESGKQGGRGRQPVTVAPYPSEG